MDADLLPVLVHIGAAVEWCGTGSIDEGHYLNQLDITFPVMARSEGSRVLE